MIGRTIFILTTLLLALPLSAFADPVIVVRSASGANAGAIQGAVDQFRADLGSPNSGNAVGTQPGGRREINWDGGGANNTAPAGTPFTGFQNRGAIITTPSTGFLQTPVNTAEFLTINPTYGTNFQFFSPVGIFTSLGSNILDVTFSVPGSNGATPALVAGFGAVFSDVDLANTTSIQFFDVNNNNSLGTFFAPTANNGLSFLGVLFDSAIVSRVRIINGNSALGPNDSNGNPVDVVVMNDLIYGEPQATATPEPATMVLLGTSLAGVAAQARKRRRALRSADA